MLIERAVDQHYLLDMNIPIWFATKDWNFLLSKLEDAYENLVKEFYANVIVERKAVLSYTSLLGRYSIDQ